MNGKYKFTPLAMRVVEVAEGLRIQDKNTYISQRDLMRAVLVQSEGTTPIILKACGVNQDELNEKLRRMECNGWRLPIPPKTFHQRIAEQLRKLADWIG